jgi:hypothetical protein
MVLRGRQSGNVFAMGQKVTVRLAAANILKHQLDFQLISADHPKESPKPAAPNSPRRSQKRFRRRRR